MAGYFQLTFGSNRNSDISVQYSNDGSTWTNYVEPAWPPNASNRGSVLQVNNQDQINLWLTGPSGWSLSGAVQVIIARANSAPSGQAYSPFGGGVIWKNPTGSMDGATWKAVIDTIALNPGPGQANKFEITVGWNATLPNVNGPCFFSEDPEMDVEGM